MMLNRKSEVLKSNICSLKEQVARRILCNVRAQGHTYVELREDGKRLIFFCTLCLAPCYSDTVLFDHLKGNLHSERYATAKITLLGSNPWPFNDGALFFDVSLENRSRLSTLCSYSSGCSECNGNSVPIRLLSKEKPDCAQTLLDGDMRFGDTNAKAIDGDYDLVIPDVLVNDRISELGLTFMGFGRIGARFCEKGGRLIRMSKIWCEWLGKKDLTDEELFSTPEHDYAIAVFSYTYELGRQSLLDDAKLLFSPEPTETENAETSRRRVKSYSEPEDVNGSSCNQSDTFMPDQQSPSISSCEHDGEFCEKIRSKRSLRRELRRQQRLAAERICDICQHKMLLGKDVAALLNTKTEKLACSSRNLNGVFHVFHISCLIHWIIFSEFEMFENQQAILSNIDTQTRRRKGKRKINETRKEMKNKKKELKKMLDGSVFCPECQGTGLSVEDEDMEKPTFPPSEMFRFKIRVSDAHRAWMKRPELLQNCSTGFSFPEIVEQTLQEKAVPVKLLHFYTAK